MFSLQLNATRKPSSNISQQDKEDHGIAIGSTSNKNGIFGTWTSLDVVFLDDKLEQIIT